MDLLRKFRSGDQVLIFDEGEFQTARIVSVENFYLHAKIGLNKEQRFSKEDFMKLVKSAKDHKQKLNGGNEEQKD
jgi:hypothetical protein